MGGFCTGKSTHAHGALLLSLFISGKEKQSKAGDKEGIQEEGVGSRAMSTHLGGQLIQITEATKKRERERDREKELKKGKC